MITTPKQKLIADKRVQDALKICKAAQSELAEKFAHLEPFLNPPAYMRALQDVINNATDADDIRVASERLASFSQNLSGTYLTPAGEVAKSRANNICFALQDELRKTIPALLEAGEAVASKLLQEAKNEEARFFEANQLKWEPTSVSRPASVIAEKLRSFRESFEGPQQHRSNANAEAYSYYINFFSEITD
jgi:hypothetical protein